MERLLDAEASHARLAPPDRALAQELAYGVVRWETTLDWLIARKATGRPRGAALRVLLRLGLYQMFWLERIPDHAAVNETVALARQHGLRHQAGFVNAVLRAYGREKPATRQALQELKDRDPALGWSHPPWLVERWTRRWGPAEATRLLQWNNTPPRAFARINTLRAPPAEVLERWRQEGVEYSPGQWDWIPEQSVFELKSFPPLAGLGSFHDGWFYLQDPSTLLAVSTLDPQPGECVLDLCAAPGGKTTLLAERMRNRGRIVALETSPDRLALVRANCVRLGVTCVETNLTEATPPLTGGPRR